MKTKRLIKMKAVKTPSVLVMRMIKNSLCRRSLIGAHVVSVRSSQSVCFAKRRQEAKQPHSKGGAQAP